MDEKRKKRLAALKELAQKNTAPQGEMKVSDDTDYYDKLAVRRKARAEASSAKQDAAKDIRAKTKLDEETYERQNKGRTSEDLEREAKNKRRFERLKIGLPTKE
jgi:hypothetical protein